MITLIILILGSVDTIEIISQEDPSYISGIQKCNGKSVSLKQKDNVNKPRAKLFIFSLHNNTKSVNSKENPVKNKIVKPNK